MSILEIAEELRKIAEKKSEETGLTIQEIWSDAVKELNELYEKREREE